jgi:hypothetical protein
MVLIPKDNRRYPRISIDKPLRYQVRGMGGYESAIAENISVGGLGFINNEFISPKTPLMLEINVLSRILRPVGQVTRSFPLPHSSRYYSGVEFLEFNQVEKRYLSDYIDMQTGKI